MPTRDIIPILPEAILAIAGTLVMLLAAFRKKDTTPACSTVALLGIFAAAACVGKQWQRQGAAFNEMLAVDPFSIFFQFLFLAIAALVILFSSDYLRRERLAAGEYYALLL